MESTQSGKIVDSEFLSEFDLHLFHEGTHYRLYEKMGAHLASENGIPGVHFGVWAPNAQRVYALGNFNGWDEAANPLSQHGEHGVWAGFVPGVGPGEAYHYRIVSWHQGYQVNKADPFGFRQEGSPRYSTLVWPLGYKWGDAEWMGVRRERNSVRAPIAMYEVHLGSWMRVPEEGNRWLTFREIAPKLADHVERTGFTHVELLPVMEHPLNGGQEEEVTGHYAPASRWGVPQDLMYLVDTLHQRGIGVVLNWVPGSFGAGEQGLGYFDGTYLYERGGWPMAGPGVGHGRTHRFDFARGEVRSYLASNAFYWLDKFHVDGLRVTGTSSVLLLDRGQRTGEWVPNRHGGRENADGIGFLRQVNAEVSRVFPDVLRIAEEETNWPMTTEAPERGGLGFSLRCEPDFAREMLGYLGQESGYRKSHHGQLTRRTDRAFGERLILGLSHAETGAGKSSFLARMAGDEWQRFANLRLLLGYQYTQPGKKRLFMGTEFAQWETWQATTSLDWHLLAYPNHSGTQLWVGDLNKAYREEGALHDADDDAEGFEWVDRNDAEQGTVSWLRRDRQRREVLLVVCNFTPAVLRNVHVGVRRPGHWREILNSDAKAYGGSGQGNLGGAATTPFPSQHLPHTLSITAPPLGMVVFKHAG